MKIALDDRGERPCRQARLTFPVRTRGCIPIRAAPWEDLDAGEDLIRIVDEPRGRSGAGPRVEFRIRKFDGCEGEIREIGLDDLFDLVTRQPHRDGRITLPDADARPCASPAW